MNYKLDPQESVQTSSPRQTKQPHSHGRRLIFHVILIGALAFATNEGSCLSRGCGTT